MNSAIELQALEAKRICAKCVEDTRFSNWISEKSNKKGCSYKQTHKNTKSVLLKQFVEHVDAFFQTNYCPGTSERKYSPEYEDVYYEQQGDSLEDCIAELLSPDDEPLQDIVALLPHMDWVDVAGGEEWFYESDLFEKIEDIEHREQIDAYERWFERRHELAWDDFCRYVKYENRTAQVFQKLSQLFDDMQAAEASHKRSPIRVLPKGSIIYRARKLRRNDSQSVICKDRQFVLPPAPDIAIEGRMNHAFIPVFYGAFSADGAVVECQPYIDQRIAVGEFQTTKPLKVLDFTVYDGLFDHLYADKKSSKWVDPRYALIRHMQAEISKPIAPDNKALDYISTQVLTEFLKEHFQVDGIIFFSSLLTLDKDVDHRNIVLFKQLMPLAQSEANKKAQNLWPVHLKKDGLKFRQVKAIKYTIENAALTWEETMENISKTMY